MKRLFTTAVLAAALSCAWLSATPASAQPQAKRVVIVLAPYLTWSDVTPTSTPTIWKLADKGAIGDINARSRARRLGEPSSPLEGALTISAGAWSVPDFQAAAAYHVNERYEVGDAAEAFRRTTGYQVRANQIVFLGMPVTQRANAERSFEVVLGTLGQAVEDAGGLTAAVGNSDVGYVTGEQRKVRAAALAAMNQQGLVAAGDVSARLLREDPNAPFGIETDPDAFDRALQDVASASMDVTGPALVVLDAGDAYRAARFESQVTTAIAARHRQHAVEALDHVVAMAGERFPDATLIVASQSTLDPSIGRLEGLGPIVVSGEGWSGFLTSSSTQRSGFVTNLDLTATVLDIFGIERPVQVLGNEMTLLAAPESLEARIAILDRMNRTAVSVDAAKPGVVNGFVMFTVLVLLLSSMVIVRSRLWSSRLRTAWVYALGAALLYALCIPVSSWLMFAWMPWPATVAEVLVGLFASATALWLLSLISLKFLPPRVPVAALSLLTSLVLLVDQFLGAPASFTNIFGYSPLMAARFYGIGNEASAILFGATIVGLAMLFDEWAGKRWTSVFKRLGLPVVGVVIVVVSAAPFLGANVGVVAWGTVGFVLAWVLMNGRHVSFKTGVWIALIVIVVVGAFAAIDLFGGGEKTHLARALESADSGGVIELWKIVARKAETNMRVLTHTRWAYILIAVVAFLAFMRWRPQGDFADTLAENPNFADAITVSLVAGLAAYFTEDSGIVLPALEVFYIGVALAWLMLARLLDAPSRPDTQRADVR
ncbi:MAG: hypothetical protein U1E26_05610 [Coriobacteriia bacterium]|nr:hypothetical protein [Coriobacteriia bacterium]